MRLATLLIFFPLLFACSTTSYNATVYPYEISEKADTTPIKRVVMATVNMGKPSRKYLRKHEDKVNKLVADYLQANSIQIAPSNEFATRWESAIRTYGEVYDPSTDRINPNSFQLVHATVMKSLQEETDIEAVVYTDLIAREVMFTGNKHLARWDGVSRKVSIRGSGDGVPADFSWVKTADAVSLMVTIYRLSDFEKIFRSVGGVEVTDSLNLRSTPKFVRRRNVLDAETHIQEGIELAFHPWIVMKRYPGTKR